MSYSIDSRGLIFLNGRPVALSTSEAATFQKNVVLRWSSLAATFSQKYSFPLGWILAIIYAESAGNASAFRTEPTGQTGVGLMQITDPGLKRGLSDAQVSVPETNLDIGVKFLSNIQKAGNADLPSIASCYNCGPGPNGRPKPAPTKNPAWGICAYAGYLERVSGASNTFLTTQAARSSSSQSVLVPLVGAGLAALAVHWLLR